MDIALCGYDGCIIKDKCLRYQEHLRHLAYRSDGERWYTNCQEYEHYLKIKDEND